MIDQFLSLDDADISEQTPWMPGNVGWTNGNQTTQGISNFCEDRNFFL